MRADNNSPLKLTAFVSVASSGWLLLYLALRRSNPSQKPEWHCRIVTLVHALSITALTYYIAFYQGPWPFTYAGELSTPLQTWAVATTLSYFIFDFSWCIYHQTEGAVMLIHHCISLVGTSVTAFDGSRGTEMCATLLGTEISNPLLQLRWFLREAGYHKTWFAEIVDLAFMLVFGIMRLGVGTVLLYTYHINPKPDWFGRLGGTAIYAVGWIFWISIVQYAIRKYTKMYRNWRYKDKKCEDRNLKASKTAVEEQETIQGAKSGVLEQNGNYMENGIQVVKRAVMLIHHFLSILGTGITSFSGKYGTEMCATIFGTEISNPLLQLRWFLREAGYHKTWLAEFVDLAFMFVFGIMRLGVGSSLLYHYNINPTPDFWGRLGGFAIYTISWVFWISIVQYAIRKYSRMYRNWRSQGKNPEDRTAKTNGMATDETVKTNGTKNGLIQQNGSLMENGVKVTKRK